MIAYAPLKSVLFSAILTAFLIESKDLLQEDHPKHTVKLLLLIAQSQRRVEQNTPQTTSDAIEFPEFSAPMYARWVNGL